MPTNRRWVAGCTTMSVRFALLVVIVGGFACGEDPSDTNASRAALASANVVCPIPVKGTNVAFPGCPVCGDDLCQAPETPQTCPADCGGPVCGNGSCEQGEGTTTCPSDCGSACGDGVCNGAERTTTCPSDCGSVCGDGVCNGSETVASCAADCGVPQDPAFQETVLQSGSAWQLKNLTGTAVDEQGVSRPVNENFYELLPDGLQSAPLPPSVRQQLITESDGQPTVITVSKQIADDIELSLAQGYLTPSLAAIAEPQDGAPALAQNGQVGRNSIFGSCSDRTINKSQSLNVNTPINQAINPGGGFSGNVSATGNIQANATSNIQLALKRYAIFWVCIPYGVRFDFARSYGTATVSYGSNISGTINYSNAWEWELAKIGLGSINFWIGPIPVHIGFNLPINLGLELQASATGSVTYTGSQSATGSFDYTCRLSGCAGSSSYTQTNPVSPQIGTAGVSGRIQPNVWLQVALRAYLYDEWVAYAQVGIRPYVRGDLWGYYGNNCGDADADGLFETVNALTLDLDLQVHLTAQARAFGGTPTQWNDLWHTSRRHLGFWDLTGSSALRPMLGGPASVSLNTSPPYTALMRPCYPYQDPVNYQLNWGDGSASSLRSFYQGATQQPGTATHLWSTLGARTLTLTALNDDHGRSFNQSTARGISVSGSCNTNQVPTMTSASTPSGLVTRSGAYDPSYEAWQAFDASSSSMWLSATYQTPAWLGYEWTDGPRTIRSYAINFSNGSLTSRAPRDWTFEGWNGASWIVLDSRSAQTGWLGSDRREYTVATPGSYSKYRLNMSDDNDSRAGVVVISIARLELIGCP
jgi:hypothetical protein